MRVGTLDALNRGMITNMANKRCEAAARFGWVALLAMNLLGGCASVSSHKSVTALDHFFKVDDGLYRGAQPTDEGFRQLKAMGVKTIVSLRAQSSGESRPERELVESLGMGWHSFRMRMYWRPSDSQARAFLALALDPANQPVFVHCQRGEDRTGSLVALYRIVKQGWQPQEAYHEALALGLAPWNPFMRKLILERSSRFRPQVAAVR